LPFERGKGKTKFWNEMLRLITQTVRLFIGYGRLSGGGENFVQKLFPARAGFKVVQGVQIV